MDSYKKTGYNTYDMTNKCLIIMSKGVLCLQMSMEKASFFKCLCLKWWNQTLQNPSSMQWWYSHLHINALCIQSSEFQIAEAVYKSDDIQVSLFIITYISQTANSWRQGC